MIKIFAIIGYLEGISYLVLFFNMLVIKSLDIAFYKTLLFPIGITHGFLFIAYFILAIMLKVELNWSFKKFLLIFIASLIPFGTFYSDRNWLHKKI
ncbi:DUF3817 domain-containing protein [Myroides injenensis]|uniref:DUF3817 domain-containing protein n=1 Tax=Myroides injenensis TaxID=1183151 RepID=UPI0002886E1D|nr:DUF3817 domain-containing protein [Myroides injenensis]